MNEGTWGWFDSSVFRMTGFHPEMLTLWGIGEILARDASMHDDDKRRRYKASTRAGVNDKS